MITGIAYRYCRKCGNPTSVGDYCFGCEPKLPITFDGRTDAMRIKGLEEKIIKLEESMNDLLRWKNDL